MAEKFSLPASMGGHFYGCEVLGRMVPVEACRVHSQGLVRESYASEHVLENCKGCTRWQALTPEEEPKRVRPKLAPLVTKPVGRKKLSL